MPGRQHDRVAGVEDDAEERQGSRGNDLDQLAKAELSGPREFQRLLFDMFGVGMHNAAVADALRRFVREDRTQIERLAREVLAQRRTRSPENRGPREIADFVGIEEVPAIAAAVWGGIFGIYLQSLVDPELDAEAAMDAFARMVMTST